MLSRVGENIIGAPKMQNDYGVIFFLCNIAIGILNFFSIASCTVIALDLL